MAIIFESVAATSSCSSMYKALFELASDRADSCRCCSATPAGRGSDRSRRRGAVHGVRAVAEERREEKTERDQDKLTSRRAPAAAGGLEGVEYVYHAFSASGFAVRASPTYAELMPRPTKRERSRAIRQRGSFQPS